MTRRARSEAGMTMVELLISVAIVGAIAPAIAGALLVGWRTTDATVDHLGNTGNRQRVPAFLVRDVQSATAVDTNSADTTCTTAGDTLVVRMRWSETVSGASVNRVVSYVRRGTAPDMELVHRACGDSSGSTASTGNVRIAYRLTATPTVACFNATGATTSPACTSVASVVLTVTDASGSFTAAARRRTS